MPSWPRMPPRGGACRRRSQRRVRRSPQSGPPPADLQGSAGARAEGNARSRDIAPTASILQEGRPAFTLASDDPCRGAKTGSHPHSCERWLAKGRAHARVKSVAPSNITEFAGAVAASACTAKACDGRRKRAGRLEERNFLRTTEFVARIGERESLARKPQTG
jgi:hypothetical protein